MQFTMKLTAWMLAGILAMGAFAPAANACSLPYVDDVNDWGAKTSICTVYAIGNKTMTLKAVDTKTHKAVKAKKVKKGVWMVVMKHKHTYKLTVREKGCKAKTIRYRIG